MYWNSLALDFDLFFRLITIYQRVRGGDTKDNGVRNFYLKAFNWGHALMLEDNIV